MSTPEHPERRGPLRPETPPCQRCQTSVVLCVVRTEMVVYFRCTQCGEVWSTPKPDVERV
jgi:uncharacterized Zn finger protein